MPTLSLNFGTDGRPQFKTTHELSPGTYHTSALAMNAEAQKYGILVKVGSIEILKANDNRILYTHSLNSCFPVIFKFKNGDIGLYHGYVPALGNVEERDGTVLKGKALLPWRLKVIDFM
ncbi:Uncharacterised protein [Legionella steigerwaltii]|uniref:Uncharacterized protein n=1 Tax=Legionella steigerwaltii TaxID=460 RepID=A0A378LB53_9GAMM|nr:hypothetical protein [Legionella steigerwaltii]KTD80774.1 hypothetical protein Lstg_0001 [Legionella steigerwaltii]STY23540.1 Uncharacterised protein [Legionella steigerwaltii]